jgi:transposase
MYIVHPKLKSDSMTYIEIKTVHGRQYKYLRKSIRDGEKVRHVMIKCLGPVHPIYKTKKSRKTNASVYVKSITLDERDALRRSTRSTTAFVRDRAKILLLSSQRYIPREIADKTGCEARKVRNAIKAFNQHGLKTLNRGKAPGAEPKFSKEQKAQILMIAATEPKKIGLHFSTWSLQKLHQYIISQGVVDSICIETIRCLLKQEGMKLRKSKRFQYSNDPQFAKKNSG